MAVEVEQPVGSTAVRPGLGRPEVLRIVGVGLLGYLLSSLGVWLAARHYHWSVAYAFRRWDSVHYLDIARHGYPALRLSSSGPVPRSDWAFFPAYPLTIRAVHLLAVPWTVSGWVVNAGCGLAAFVVIVLVVRHWWSDQVAVRTAHAVALFPGSAVLVMAYSEGLFLLLASSTLLAVTRRRWLVAGLLCAAATGARANGIYLAAVLGVAALVAVVTRRDWWALLAPLLAPLGLVTFMLYGWQRSGRWDAWYATQKYGWHQRSDFQAETWRVLTTHRPFSDYLHQQYVPAMMVLGAAYVLLIVAIACARRQRMPWLLALYTVAMVLPLLVSSRLGWRPRFLLLAFPLMTVPARALSRWWFLVYCILSAAALVAAASWFAGPVPA